MKKVLLTAMTLVSIATSSVFGMYGANDDWIDFLTHGNQFRARMDQLGFVLGNDTIKGTFGFRSEGSPLGAILNISQEPDDSDITKKKKVYPLNFTPTLSAGIGYTSSAFGIGLGYNYTYIHEPKEQNIDQNNVRPRKDNVGLSVHTPVLAINALNNNLRIAVPISIAVKSFDTAVSGKDYKTDYMGLSIDSQIRYYTGIDAFSLIRLHIQYGQNTVTAKDLPTVAKDYEKMSLSSFGMELRLYFLKTTVGNVGLDPFLKVIYQTSLDAKGKNYIDGANVYNITAGSAVYTPKVDNPDASKIYENNPYNLEILPSLGLNASSDIVTLYLEPSLGYRAKYDGKKDSEIEHALRWNAYGEIYIRPVQDLEWYFEAEIGNSEKGDNYVSAKSVQFAGTTGITWYLPSFGSAQ